jgi:hypothetical protein
MGVVELPQASLAYLLAAPGTQDTTFNISRFK